MDKRTWRADVTDPVTGDVTSITADSETDLDHLIDAHLAGDFELPSRDGPIDTRDG